MNITADAVKQLRERTGAGMMECKKALVETKGDLDAAADLMRKQGLAKADKKASRVAAEGRGRGREVGRCARPPHWSRSIARPTSWPGSRISAPSRRPWRRWRWPASRPRWRLCSAAKLPSGETVEEKRRALDREDRREHQRSSLHGAELGRSPGRLCARHPHRRVGCGEGRRCRSRARPRDARSREQPEVPQPGADSRGRRGQGARHPDGAGAGRGQAAGDRREDGRGTLAQVAGGDHPRGTGVREGSRRHHREAAEGREGRRSPPTSASRSAPASRRSRRTSSRRSWRRCRARHRRSTDAQRWSTDRASPTVHRRENPAQRGVFSI